MAKKEKLVPGEYIVNVEKQTVVYTTTAHGIRFVGIANCGPKDKFDEETGKAIAKMRATLEQRRYDLGLTRDFIAEMKDLLDYKKRRNGGVVSPHFMRAIQAAADEEKAQLAHIRDLKNRIEAYN
jgi:hypothetical protein